jgi:hypothetical protein
LSYRGRRAVKDAAVVERMKELSAQYPRYGYRRIQIFLARDGHRMSAGRAYRLWRAVGLQVPRKRPRKRISAARPRPQAPCGPNQVWSYDFVFDHCANGQQLKCLAVTDEFTKEGLAIDVDGRIRSARVIEVLSRLVSVSWRHRARPDRRGRAYRGRDISMPGSDPRWTLPSSSMPMATSSAPLSSGPSLPWATLQARLVGDHQRRASRHVQEPRVRRFAGAALMGRRDVGQGQFFYVV